MRKFLFTVCFFVGCLFLYTHTGNAQDQRLQYPPVLRNSYFGVNIGYINYPFSSRQLETGYTVQSVNVPHTAVRIVLFGHSFTPNFSAQVSYMRPVKWVEYRGVDGTGDVHTVWMNFGTLTALGHLPLGKKWTLSGEGGMAIVTRKGFLKNGSPVVKDASYTGLIAGAQLDYHPSGKWGLHIGAQFSPAHAKDRQPSTVFYSAGFNYFLRALPDAVIQKKARGNFRFPRQQLQAGYTTNGAGYGVNDFVSKGAIPVFWGGEAQVRQGFTLHYQRNLFHARKVFALDWGASFGWWQTRQNRDRFLTFSLYPVAKFTALRFRPFDVYFEYAVAGPTYISKTLLDSHETGRHFTFLDFMGIGIVAGKNRTLVFNTRIAHFSNGNIYPRNDGVMVPLTFSLGYSW